MRTVEVKGCVRLDEQDLISDVTASEGLAKSQSRAQVGETVAILLDALGAEFHRRPDVVINTLIHHAPNRPSGAE